MTSPRHELFDDLERFITSSGVQVRLKDMAVEKPGEFDGPSITINPKHDREASSYYLTHSFGSIYQWSTDFEHAKKVFDELRDAKRSTSPGFEAALEAWRVFEQGSSEHAVWLLAEVGHPEAIDPYTVFFRADIEAMTMFHRTGKEPRWPDFFADWKENVVNGKIHIKPFSPRLIEPFTPVQIETQEVLQERD